MAAKQKLQLALLVFLVGGCAFLPHGVDAIKCFKCDNHNGPRDVRLLCDPPKSSDNGRITECQSGVCSQTNWLGVGDTTGLKCDGCIYRGCGHAGTPSGCKNLTGVDPRDNAPFLLKECHCNTPLCNINGFTKEELRKSELRQNPTPPPTTTVGGASSLMCGAPKWPFLVISIIGLGHLMGFHLDIVGN